MNRTKSVSFSEPVLRGLRAKGVSLAAVQRATRVSARFLIEVLDGRREFTDAQIARLEALSGLTGGQLAASVLEPHGGPLTELSEIWADVHRTISPTRRRRPRGARMSAAVTA